MKMKKNTEQNNPEFCFLISFMKELYEINASSVKLEDKILKIKSLTLTQIFIRAVLSYH